MFDLVTIIVPVYKVEEYLDQCIESIVKQDYTNLEIILIDDGSPDECAAICDCWAVKDSRIHIIHKQNGGLSSARNAGLDICTGRYITFIDSDDWVDEKYISVLLAAMRNHDADISSCNAIVHDEITGETRTEDRKTFTADTEEALEKLYRWKFPVCAAPKMYASHIWRELRFPVGRNYEDAYTTYLAIDAAEKILQISEALYNFRVRPNSITHSAFSLKILEWQDAWKENYLFCKQKYPRVAPYARMAWLEHIPPLLDAFPSRMTKEEKAAKRMLKGEIWDNIGFILFRMPIKKAYYQIRGLLFL